MRRDTEEEVAKGCKKLGKMEENIAKTMSMEEKMNGKLGKPKENQGNRWENEEIAGRKPSKNCRKTQEKV